MTVLIYLDTSTQVGDPDHFKVFASADAAEAWFAENDSDDCAGRRRQAVTVQEVPADLAQRAWGQAR